MFPSGFVDGAKGREGEYPRPLVQKVEKRAEYGCESKSCKLPKKKIAFHIFTICLKRAKYIHFSLG